ncbi:MAG: hypothetical protein ACJ8AW_25315 [Rhodopila sp.]
MIAGTKSRRFCTAARLRRCFVAKKTTTIGSNRQDNKKMHFNANPGVSSAAAPVLLVPGRNTRCASDTGVKIHRYARNPIRLHEDDQLIASDIEEQVADAAAFPDPDRVGDDRPEARDVLMEGAGLVEGRRPIW